MRPTRIRAPRGTHIEQANPHDERFKKCRRGKDGRYVVSKQWFRAVTIARGRVWTYAPSIAKALGIILKIEHPA